MILQNTDTIFEYENNNKLINYAVEIFIIKIEEH
jgi:hypothetical protein